MKKILIPLIFLFSCHKQQSQQIKYVQIKDGTSVYTDTINSNYYINTADRHIRLLDGLPLIGSLSFYIEFNVTSDGRIDTNYTHVMVRNYSGHPVRFSIEAGTYDGTNFSFHIKNEPTLVVGIIVR